MPMDRGKQTEGDVYNGSLKIDVFIEDSHPLLFGTKTTVLLHLHKRKLWSMSMDLIAAKQ